MDPYNLVLLQKGVREKGVRKIVVREKGVRKIGVQEKGVPYKKGVIIRNWFFT